jgi:hypothetical protein
MSKDDPLNLLWDFVYWVRKRRPLHENARDAWVSGETLEYVTQGVERFLEGKNPWPKPPGRKPESDMMWKCYWLTNFPEKAGAFLPQHSEEGGAFQIVGERLNLSPKTVESHASKARKLLNTKKGVQEFQDWLTKYKDNGLSYVTYPANHPSAIAEREQQAAAGLRTGYTKAGRKRRSDGISDKIDQK